ncbi:MAG TPA: extracellular solute-binding protein [Firmicutes bacterium]|nr:extracellular solute-binding protein [Bacillota bacterium]
MFRRRSICAGLSAIILGLLLSTSVMAAPVKLELWTFAAPHAKWFQYIADRFTKEVNPKVEIEVLLTTNTALYMDKFKVSLVTNDAPDLVDIEHNYFSSCLQLDRLPFINLTPLLEKGGYMEQLVVPRQIAYSWQGQIYGIEHALAPVVLFYRRDLFANFGFPDKINTWDEYVQLGQKLDREKHAMSRFARSVWEILYRQQGGDIFDINSNVTSDTEMGIKTYEWMMDQVKTGVFAAPPNGNFWDAIRSNFYLTEIGPDWQGDKIESGYPEQSGLWGAMPLPYWPDDPERRQTSVFGGTGLLITDNTKHPDEAWQFLQFAMLSVEGAVSHFEQIGFFPVYIPAFRDARLRKERPFFGGQRLGELYATVGYNVPTIYPSPYRRDWYDIFAPYEKAIADGVKPVRTALVESAELLRAIIRSDAANK